MKDKSKAKTISKFVGLKSKMFSLVFVDGKENKKAKGINENIVTNTRYEQFFDILFHKKLIRHIIKRIRKKLINTLEKPKDLWNFS